MTFYLNNNLTYLQKSALEEVLKTMKSIRNTICEEGEDFPLADVTDRLVSDVEQLYLEFSNDKKRYF